MTKTQMTARALMLVAILALLWSASACALPSEERVRGLEGEIRALADDVGDAADGLEAARAAADAALTLPEGGGVLGLALAALHAWRNHTRRRDVLRPGAEA